MVLSIYFFFIYSLEWLGYPQ